MIPENWRRVPQSAVCGLANGEKRENEPYPYWEVKALRGTKEREYASSGRFVEKGTKVILVDGENSGEIFDVAEDGYMGSTFRALSIEETVLPQYLQLFILLNKDLYRNNKRGSAIPHLDKGLFFSTPFPLPPLPEQERIAGRVESLFARLDEAADKLQTVVEGYELRRAALLHKAFTGELTAGWREARGAEAGRWATERLGKYATSQYGYTESASPELVGPKFLRITDIQNGAVQWDKVPYCKISRDDFAKYAVRPCDIVVARTGATTGKSCLITDDIRAVFASYLIRLTIRDSGLLPGYLYHFMQSQSYWSQISEFSAGIAQPGVNAKKLREIKLPVPPLEEQAVIVRILDGLLRRERRALSAAREALAQIPLMKRSVLARAFRGELGTNNPAEEPCRLRQEN
nr:restriction endonuclease subunit S [uncultured Oscillibacter sp.]